jgi:hypothetical protein
MTSNNNLRKRMGYAYFFLFNKCIDSFYKIQNKGENYFFLK